MRDKNEGDKVDWLFAYLDDEAWASYCAKFIAGCSLTVGGRDYDAVCKWFVLHFPKAVEPDELIRIAMDSRLGKMTLFINISYWRDV